MAVIAGDVKLRLRFFSGAGYGIDVCGFFFPFFFPFFSFGFTFPYLLGPGCMISRKISSISCSEEFDGSRRIVAWTNLYNLRL